MRLAFFNQHYPLEFIKVVRLIVCSFLLSSSVPQYGYTTTCLTIHLQENIWVFSSWELLKIKHLQTCMYRFLCDHKFFFSWDKCPQTQVLGCMVVACLVLKEIAKVFSRVAVPLDIPTSNVWMIQLLHIFDIIWCCHYYFLLYPLNRHVVICHCVSICTFLMMSNTVPICHLYILFSEMFSYHVPIFKIRMFAFLHCWVLRIHYIF